MTDREILEQLLAGQQEMHSDITEMRSDITEMRSHISDLQLAHKETNTRLSKLEDEVSAMKLRLENTTDKNIQLIAENYSNLVEKLDKNNVITDQQFAYQVKVNYLIEYVRKLRKDVKELQKAIRA